MAKCMPMCDGMRWRLIRSLAMGAALLSYGAISHAEEIGYPKDVPRFTFQAPEGWRIIFRNDSLTLLPEPEDGFVVQVHEQPAAAQEILPQLARRVAEQMKLIDVQIGAASEAENEHDVECTVLTSIGHAGEETAVVTLIAFSIEDERHFTIQSAGAASLNKKHHMALLSLADSIKPIEED